MHTHKRILYGLWVPNNVDIYRCQEDYVTDDFYQSMCLECFQSNSKLLTDFSETIENGPKNR